MRGRWNLNTFACRGNAEVGREFGQQHALVQSAANTSDVIFQRLMEDECASAETAAHRHQTHFIRQRFKETIGVTSALPAALSTVLRLHCTAVDCSGRVGLPERRAWRLITSTSTDTEKLWPCSLSRDPSEKMVKCALLNLGAG